MLIHARVALFFLQQLVGDAHVALLLQRLSPVLRARARARGAARRPRPASLVTRSFRKEEELFGVELPVALPTLLLVLRLPVLLLRARRSAVRPPRAVPSGSMHNRMIG